MNPNQTIDKIKHMRLHAMAELYHQSINQNLYSDMNQDEWMTMLVDQEWQERQNKKIQSLMHRSEMSKHISTQDIDYNTHRKLDKVQYQRLMSLSFLANNENIIITGPAGIGKSYLAQAIGHQACQMLHKVHYFILARLFDHARKYKVEGKYLNFLKNLHRSPYSSLMILDYTLYKKEMHKYYSTLLKTDT